jgi:Zn-dependent alcohol dehydrogenase
LNVRAAVVHGPNQPFVVEEVQLEGPRAGEVLMQVKTTGLCHSDLHAYEAKVPWQFPAILGHEAAGIVIECGPGVTQFKPGDHVIPFLIPHCGKCAFCNSPKTNLCIEAFARLRPRESRFSLCESGGCSSSALISSCPALSGDTTVCIYSFLLIVPAASLLAEATSCRHGSRER